MNHAGLVLLQVARFSPLAFCTVADTAVAVAVVVSGFGEVALIWDLHIPYRG